MDALDHKLSTELTEMKKLLISLHRQTEVNPSYSSDTMIHPTKVCTDKKFHFDVFP